MQPIIRVKDLSKRFGTAESEVRALEHIDLDIYPGDIFGIIGMSGAGKSTLLRCINLLEKPSSGHVVIDGQDITGFAGR